MVTNCTRFGAGAIDDQGAKTGRRPIPFAATGCLIRLGVSHHHGRTRWDTRRGRTHKFDRLLSGHRPGLAPLDAQIHFNVPRLLRVGNATEPELAGIELNPGIVASVSVFDNPRHPLDGRQRIAIPGGRSGGFTVRHDLAAAFRDVKRGRGWSPVCWLQHQPDDFSVGGELFEQFPVIGVQKQTAARMCAVPAERFESWRGFAELSEALAILFGK
jgi:hypothetical protein